MLELARAYARKLFGASTPYRVGYVMGQYGAGDAPNPYPPGTRGARNYAEGIAWGVHSRTMVDHGRAAQRQLERSIP